MSAMSDMSWMASAAGLMEALSSSDIKTFDRWWQNMAASTGKSVIYPKLAEQIVQMIDNAFENPRKDATGIVGKMMKDIPIVRHGYNDMLNAVGEPIQYDPYMMIERETTDPFWNYVVKHNAWIGKPTQKATVIYDGEVERGLTDDEYYQYIKLSGTAIKDRIMNEVMPLELDDEEIKRAVDSIKSEERTKAREMISGWSELRVSNPDVWNFLSKNDILPTRGNVKIGDRSIKDNKELAEFFASAEKKYPEILKLNMDSGDSFAKTLTEAEAKRWRVIAEGAWKGAVAQTKVEWAKKADKED